MCWLVFAHSSSCRQLHHIPALGNPFRQVLTGPLKILLTRNLLSSPWSSKTVYSLRVVINHHQERKQQGCLAQINSKVFHSSCRPAQTFPITWPSSETSQSRPANKILLLAYLLFSFISRGKRTTLEHHHGNGKDGCPKSWENSAIKCMHFVRTLVKEVLVGRFIDFLHSYGSHLHRWPWASQVETLSCPFEHVLMTLVAMCASCGTVSQPRRDQEV